MRIAVIGGTGKEGRGLAIRWARAGHDVIIGSRDAARAQEKAAEMEALIAPAKLRGADNAQAARDSELVVLSVPYAGHGDPLRELKPALEGRILLDIPVPFRPPKVSEVQLPEGQSAAME